MAKRVIAARLFCAVVAASASTAAVAQAGLPDPTRPPSATAEDTARSVVTQGARSPSRVQSVLISPERKIAVIDGRTVALGARIDDAVVVGIAETGVTLRRGNRTEVLPLNAGVEIRRVTP
jgi:MSHA biogenesis protein MshK